MADNSDRARTGMDPRRRRLASQLKGKQPEGDDTTVAASCGCAGPDAAVPGEQIVAEAGAPTALIVYKRRARQPPAALPRGCSPFAPIATIAPPRGRSDTGPGPGPDERRVTKPPARGTVLTVSDKGKGVATEHALVRQRPEGFMADARRGRQPLAVLPATEQTSDSQMRGGFMADARRARQPPPAPLNHPSLSSTSRPRYGSERRYIATVDFLLKPKGSKVKKPFTLCKEVFSNLLAHQVEGLDWLWNIHCCGTGGIIGDDMGIGKTKQILAFITGLFESDLIKTALVVVPSSVIHQWTKEMERNGLKKYVHIFQDKLTRNEELDVVRQSGGILVTTHTLATNNWSMLNVPWDYFVIDEAHMTCKKECLKAYQNLQKIDCPHKILLTGTPSANTLKELRAMLNFCCPGLFSSLPDFYEDYFAPIVLGNFKSSSLSQLKESSIAVKKLQHLISPCLLRRTKSVLSSEDTPESKRLDLPEKLEFVVWLRLSVYQEKLYRTVLTSNIIDKSNQAELMVASTVLQKICNHPCNLDSKDQGKLNGDKRTVLKRIVRKLSSTISLSERNVSADHHSCKVDIIVRLLKRFRKQDLKALIFSRTCEMLDVIQEVLLKKEFLFDRIDGSLSAKERKKRLEAFKEDAGAPILLISSFAGGTGLDLPIASRAIIVEPFWNPSLDDQCADRIYRVGQKKKCIVYRLVCSETVEEIVYRTQIFKLGISNAVLEKKEIKRYIEFELKKSLLDIPPKGFENSRTLRQLEKDPPPTMSNEMCEELHFLKNLDVLGVTFHGELFQGASSKSPIRSVPSVSTDEIDWAIDEEELSRARTNEIIELEARIERYKHILNNQGLPDGGAKIIIMIESIEQKLAKLRSNTDPKEPKDNT